MSIGKIKGMTGKLKLRIHLRRREDQYARLGES
ncbi:hypothetical protein C5S53_01695, partial [Methanophagales archaeon]